MMDGCKKKSTHCGGRKLFRKPLQEGKSKKFILLEELKVCSRKKNLQRGKEVHVEAITNGLDTCIFLQSALVKMYAKCKSMAEAYEVFSRIKKPDVVSWTALIMGYAENGEGVIALDLFEKMKSQGCAPDSFTFVAVIKACTALALDQNLSGKTECLKRGREIHSQIGYHLNMFVESVLIDMYSNCGSMVEARQVFDNMKDIDVVSWNALIMGYVDNGQCVTTLNLFARMKSQGFTPNFRTFVAVLKACGSLGALECGSRIHAEINTGNRPDVILVTCLVDFYARCGNLLAAHKVFDLYSSTRNIATWNALLGGYSRMGEHEIVCGLVEQMVDACLKPDSITFSCILMCCSHAGLVDKGKEWLEAMSTKYGITPTVEHYTCLVDGLGRSNRLNEVVSLLDSMPCKPNTVTWMTILDACRKWKNVDIGMLAFKALVGLDDTNASAYVLMASIYKSLGMWKEQEVILAMREELRAWKQPEQTCWTNEDGEVHTFLVGDGLRAWTSCNLSAHIYVGLLYEPGVRPSMDRMN